MNTTQTPLDSQRHVLALLDRLHVAERAIDPAHGYASRMMEFEQEQLLAELAQMTDGGDIKLAAAESPTAQKVPWSLKAALASMLDGFVGALKTRTA